MFFITLMMFPSSSNSFLNNKINICQTCGDKGHLDKLIYCVQCKVSAEHIYCIGKLHEYNGTIGWKCAECSLIDAKCRSEPLRRSARLSEAIQTKYVRVKHKREGLEEACLVELCKAETCKESQDLPIKKRRCLDVKDEILIDEECDKDVDTKTADTETFCEPYLESCNFSQANPASSPAWSGQLRINKLIRLGVGAHISTLASPKVLSTVSGLPPVVDVKLLSRREVWPPSFERLPPTNGNIGLFIFPQNESDEKVYDRVISDVIESDLAFKATIIPNVELLIFSSLVLPSQDWRLSGKYYLWGIFRQKKAGDGDV